MNDFDEFLERYLNKCPHLRDEKSLIVSPSGEVKIVSYADAARYHYDSIKHFDFKNVRLAKFKECDDTYE